MNNDLLWYTSPAKFWTDALPLGNGSLGGMLFSGTNKDRIALNHDTLWSGYPREFDNKNAFPSYKKAQLLANEGRLYEAQTELEKNFLTSWSQAYLPLGDMYINFGMHFSKIENYKRELDISRAVHTCTYKKNKTEFKKQAFISNPDSVLVYRIKSDKKVHFSVWLNCKLKHSLTLRDNSIIIDGVCPSDSDSLSPKYPCNSLIYSKKEQEQGVSFRTAVKIITDGKCVKKGDFFNISASTDTLILLSTVTNFENGLTAPYKSKKDYKSLAVKAVENAQNKGFEALLKAHIEDYKKYYDRVTISLGKSSANASLPTDDRLARFVTDKSDTELYELLYNFSRYLLISSSRENTAATNLQGIWNESMKPAWNSNYTININTQMNYWSALKSNLSETVLPLVELVKTVSVTGEKTARSFYNAKGFVAHHNSDIWGFSVPTLGSANWGFWQGGSGWLCRTVWEYYEHTLDKNYLKNTALPLIRKAAEFYNDILFEKKDGSLCVSPSTSPENTFLNNGKEISVAKSSVITDTIVLDVFKNYLKGCDELGEKDDLYNEISEKAAKIEPLKKGSDGRLLEWDSEYREKSVNHRHLSQLIGLFPFDIINEKAMPDITEACRKSLEARGDDGTGWSLAWKINLWARLKDGNRALKLLNMQLNPVRSHKKSSLNYGGGGGTYPNMFDAHPPFQIDGNFGSASGINEMLLQSDSENIYLLPALPDCWSDGFVKGLREKGNITVDITWHNKKVTDYKIHGDLNGKKVIFS